jgi:membrane-bound lytic murein transglycosylase MltF
MIRKLAMFTLIVILLAMHVEASEIPVNHVKTTIVKHSIEMGVDPALALSIAKAESQFNHNSKSSCGAVGVFQLMPSTARKMGFNPYCLNDNIKAGLTYYKMLYKMLGSTELALAAYHTGPAYVLKHKQPAPCSKAYISKIMSEYYHLKAHTDPAIKAHNTQSKVTQSNKSGSKPAVVTQAKKPVTTTQTKVEQKTLPNNNIQEKQVKLLKEVESIKTDTAMLSPIQNEQLNSIIELNL